MPNLPIPAAVRRAAAAPALTVALTSMGGLWPGQLHAGALFSAADVDPQRFVLVAAPIGSGPRSQLNIYEQVGSRRPCFAVGEGKPAAVNPLLATFDFTGVCSRYIDANGYSLRIGGTDLATSYRLMVTRGSGDIQLLAIPTRGGAGPEMVVARTQGDGSGFLKLELEPGWTLKRRQFGGRKLGHLYLYNETWPGAPSPQQPASKAPAAPAGPPPAP